MDSHGDQFSAFNIFICNLEEGKTLSDERWQSGKEMSNEAGRQIQPRIRYIYGNTDQFHGISAYEGE